MLSWFFRKPDPFLPHWADWLREGVWQYRHLDERQRKRVQEVTAHLVARKHWTGGSGFEITEQMKVVISGVAGLLTVGLDKPFFFPRLKTFILYPAGYQSPGPTPQVGILGGGDPLFRDARLGESWQSGPVVLSWRDAQRQARSSTGPGNLVIHELTHHLDSLDGHMDGIPYFAKSSQRKQWLKVATTEYHRLLGQASRREATLLDKYGASNFAEFLAVSCECFFERPHEMQAQHSALYSLLTAFFNQDPSRWVPKPSEATPAAEPQKAQRGTRSRRGPSNLSHLGLHGPDQAFTQGMMLLESGDPQGAIRWFTETLQADPNDAEALSLRAQARLDCEDYRGARQDAEESLKIEPGDHQATLALARAALLLGDDQSASGCVSMVLSDDRLNPLANLLQGMLRFRQGDYRGAANAMKRSLLGDEHTALTHYYLASCLEHLNEPTKASAHRERALLLDPRIHEIAPKL